jgi:acetyl-CoA carboxylase biotin carboxyl carrier protein
MDRAYRKNPDLASQEPNPFLLPERRVVAALLGHADHGQKSEPLKIGCKSRDHRYTWVAQNVKGLRRMPKDNKDIVQIRELIEIMKENDLVEVTIEHGDDKLRLKRACAQTTMTGMPFMGLPVPAHSNGSAQNVTDKTANADEGLIDITSPIVGTFYEAPSPDSPHYAEIGTHVSPSSVVCIIEAMKVMNEIKAEVSGTIVQILVRNGQAVEFGQPMFKVKPN